MTLNIRQANLNHPRTPTRRTQTRHILLHHTASNTASPQDIFNWHVSGNRWSWSGYHYLVRRDGSIHQLLDVNAMGIHAREPRNSDSIAIAFEGNYQTSNDMPKVQYNSGVVLIRFIRSKFAVPISRHKDHVATACPGQHFPFTRMRDEAMQAVSPPSTDNTHTVRAGETLWSISRLHSTTVQAIKDANGLRNDSIFPNQVLTIPSGSVPSPSFFPATSQGHPSIVNMLNNINVNSSFANRLTIARTNGISDYTGTVAQNTQLANLLRDGRLIRP